MNSYCKCNWKHWKIMKDTIKKAKMQGKPVIWRFFSMFQNNYKCWELSPKTLFFALFSHIITKCAKTHAKSRFFTKIKRTHYYKYNFKAHLKSWNTLQKGHKHWFKWYFHSGSGSNTFIKKLKFLTKTLFFSDFLPFCQKKCENACKLQ